jgi:hypothetical protein
MEDVMYFGGEPVEFYEQYRRRVERREDLKRLKVLSAEDLARLREMYVVQQIVFPRAPRKRE